MRRIYEPYAYGDGPIANSYWTRTVEAPDWPRLEGTASAEIAVIGGGYTGLTAALHLAEAGADVILLDAQSPGWGASGRNGGFCCLGGTALGATDLLKRHGEADTRLYYDAEREAVALVAETLARLGIEADTHSRGETMLAHSPAAIPDLKATARHMRAYHGATCEILSREELAANGMASPEFHGAVTTPIGFALNPLKYALGLARAAQAAGARIYGRSPAGSITRQNDIWRIASDAGQVQTKRLIFATNGYSADDVPPWLAARYLPLQSNIIVTRPLSEAERAAQGWTTRQMSFDSRQLLHYFRLLPDNRMLFGMRGAIRSTPKALGEIRARTRADFDRFFPAWKGVETEHFQSGFVSLARDRTPFAGPIPEMENAFGAFNYHGNGVAMGSHAGAILADLALGRPLSRPWPDFATRPPRRFPFGRFRRALLRPVLAARARRDGG